MTSLPEKILNENLISICLDSNFKNLNCLLGTSEIIFSLIIIIITIVGLKHLLNYYEKISLEIGLLLFSIVQIILLDIIIIIPYDILFECFFFVQICHISITIRKFIMITKQDISKIKENLSFIIINIINILVFTFFILSLLDIFLGAYYIYIQCSIRVYYFITAIILTVICRALIKKIKNYEKRNESYELHLKTKNSENSFNNDNSNSNSNIILSFHNKEWMYFSMRERQIIPLYILDLICSFLQMSFIISKHFFLENYFDNNVFKIKASNNNGYIIYYIYLFICYLNVLVNYFCFYWVVRDQYNNSNEISKLNKKKKKVIDDKFITKEIIKNEEDKKEINVLMEEKIKDKKKFTKSIYSNTFTENPEDNEKDNQENYFVKEKDKDKDKDIDNKQIELKGPSSEEISGRETIISNNPINQSTINNDTLL